MEVFNHDVTPDTNKLVLIIYQIANYGDHLFGSQLSRGDCMKKSISLLRCIFMLIIWCVMLVITGCYEIHEKKYYSDVNNFITEEAVVDNIIYDADGGDIVLWLSDIHDSYQSSAFMIKGENFQVVMDREILNKIKIGDVITFTSAPGYFGNGYFMPIVAISISGEELLGFEVGYENLMKGY